MIEHSHLPKTPLSEYPVKLKVDTRFYVSPPVFECLAANSLMGEITVDEDLALESL